MFAPSNVELMNLIRTPEEVQQARSIVVDKLKQRAIQTGGVMDNSDPVTCVLIGLSVTLQWIVGLNKDTNTLSELIKDNS